MGEIRGRLRDIKYTTQDFNSWLERFLAMIRANNNMFISAETLVFGRRTDGYADCDAFGMAVDAFVKANPGMADHIINKAIFAAAAKNFTSLVAEVKENLGFNVGSTNVSWKIVLANVIGGQQRRDAIVRSERALQEKASGKGFLDRFKNKNREKNASEGTDHSKKKVEDRKRKVRGKCWQCQGDHMVTECPDYDKWKAANPKSEWAKKKEEASKDDISKNKKRAKTQK